MRRLICGLLAGLVVLSMVGAPIRASRAAAQADLPITGTAVETLAAYDQAMLQLMAKWQLPGGALAVLKNGRLVLARGYGFADRDAGRPVQPDSLFRVASLSKPVTATAILQLVEQGRLDLDAKALRMLEDLEPPGANVDPRIWEITVRQLLHHTGGWDRTDSADVMFRPRIAEATRALGLPGPASCENAISYTFTQPLDFDPGTRYAYSNLGFCILGRLIERVTGLSYAEYVTANVLGPAGASHMRIGGSTPAEHADGEVSYYDYPGAPLVIPDAPGLTGRVPNPDGGMYFGRFDSWGGWIASPIDYARFASAFKGQRGPTLLQPATMALVTERPAPPVSVDTPTFDGLGWLTRPQPNGFNIWHHGSLPGTKAMVMVRADGATFVAMFNSRPPWEKENEISLDIDGTLNGVTVTVNTANGWPDTDLFDQYP